MQPVPLASSRTQQKYEQCDPLMQKQTGTISPTQASSNSYQEASPAFKKL